ncbi:MAG: rimI1 [Herminiimonas sp.]|nr:rimI1 [Herminiimonas sp.]
MTSIQPGDKAQAFTDLPSDQQSDAAYAGHRAPADRADSPTEGAANVATGAAADTITRHAEMLRFAPMDLDDLDEVLRIEYAIYPFPWTRGNFLDSIYSRYDTWVLRNPEGELVGYFLLLVAVDESHLLNITVGTPWQGRGIGIALLDKAVAVARSHDMKSILLEVRPSNARALAIYERYGFSRIGLRKNYYPAQHNNREDAIVMRLSL